jgi:hypothetical protein
LQPVSFGVAISTADQRWQQYVDGVVAA